MFWLRTERSFERKVHLLFWSFKLLIVRNRFHDFFFKAVHAFSIKFLEFSITFLEYRCIWSICCNSMQNYNKCLVLSYQYFLFGTNSKPKMNFKSLMTLLFLTESVSQVSVCTGEPWDGWIHELKKSSKEIFHMVAYACAFEMAQNSNRLVSL